MPWTMIDSSESSKLASLESAKVSPDFQKRMSWLWAARRSFELLDSSHRLRRSLLAGARSTLSTKGIVSGELVCIWRKIKRNKKDSITPLVSRRWYGPSLDGKAKMRLRHTEVDVRELLQRCFGKHPPAKG